MEQLDKLLVLLCPLQHEALRRVSVGKSLGERLQPWRWLRNMGLDGLDRHAEQCVQLILRCPIQSQTISKEGRLLKRRLGFPFPQAALCQFRVTSCLYRIARRRGMQSIQALRQRERLIPGSAL